MKIDGLLEKAAERVLDRRTFIGKIGLRALGASIAIFGLSKVVSAACTHQCSGSDHGCCCLCNEPSSECTSLCDDLMDASESGPRYYDWQWNCNSCGYSGTCYECLAPLYSNYLECEGIVCSQFIAQGGGPGGGGPPI